MMIEVYSWPTPNGHKVHVMLEECALPYKAVAVDIGKGDQFRSDFLAISPTTRFPPSSTPTGRTASRFRCSSPAPILMYLAAKTGRFMPESSRGKYEVLQWLMFQMGGVGPMLGQAHHFRIYAPQKIPYAVERYTNEAKRLYGVMNKRLAKSKYLGGPEYSIADIAVFPWLRSLEEPGHRLGRLPASEGLVRRDRRPARGAARRGGAGRAAQAADRRQGARGAVRQGAVQAALTP